MGSIPVPLFNPSSENMKILVCVSEYYPFGTGIANVAYNIVEDLKRMGHQCVVCSPTGPDIKLGSAPLIDRWAIGGLLQYWDLVATCLNGDDYDVVWLHNPMFIRANPFRRSIATVHSTYYDKYQQRIAPVPYYAVTAALEKYLPEEDCRAGRLHRCQPDALSVILKRSGSIGKISFLFQME